MRVPLVLLARGARLVRSLDPEAVATLRGATRRFVREVEARGTLKAVKATPIVAPLQSRRSQKVAFLAQDGAFLKQGDVVVEFDPYDAQREAADGQADLAAAQREDRQGASRRRRRTSARSRSTATSRRATSRAPSSSS